jgi:hypothetical protein
VLLYGWNMLTLFAFLTEFTQYQMSVKYLICYCIIERKMFIWISLFPFIYLNATLINHFWENNKSALAQTPIVKYCRLGGLNNRILFSFIVLETGGLRSECQRGEGSLLALLWEGLPLTVFPHDFFLCTEKRVCKQAHLCFRRALIPLWGTHPHDLI